MKSLIILSILIGSVHRMHAADTVYVNAPELSAMLTTYISRAYSYQAEPFVRDLMEKHSNVVTAVDKWQQTSEGNAHSLADANWERKLQSFFRMYPSYRAQASIVRPILRRLVTTNIQLFAYAIDAQLIVVDGKAHGVVFDPKTNSEWRCLFSDPYLREIYDIGKDTSGVSWHYRIEKLIQKHTKQRRS